MKKFIFLFTVLISLLVWNKQVKADTIYYNVPGTAQLCQDPLDFDTFVFHKPNGFDVSMWYINFIYIGTGDSVIFVPSTGGDNTISCVSGGNTEQFMLSLYSAPPAHAQFQVLGGGGSVNSTNDTSKLCR